MIPGKCTKPLRLPTAAPRCFRSQQQWDGYRELANYSAGDGFTFCTDCTPEHRAEMQAQGRCQFPKTVFVKLPTGIVVGRRRHGGRHKHRSRSTKPVAA